MFISNTTHIFLISLAVKIHVFEFQAIEPIDLANIEKDDEEDEDKDENDIHF